VPPFSNAAFSQQQHQHQQLYPTMNDQKRMDASLIVRPCSFPSVTVPTNDPGHIAQGQQQPPIIPARLATVQGLIPDTRFAHNFSSATMEQPLSENISILGNRAAGDVPSLAGATTTVDAGSFDATQEPKNPVNGFVSDSHWYVLCYNSYLAWSHIWLCPF
jgi:hypothetical protein